VRACDSSGGGGGGGGAFVKGVLAGKICGRRVWEVELCATSFQGRKQEIVEGRSS
jgi:hypothetical protein